MKRIVLALLSVLTLLFAFAQLQHVLPASVLQFNDERAAMERRLASGEMRPDEMPRQFAPTRMIDGVEYADAFIGFTGTAPETMLKALGVRVNCVFDDFLTAYIPVDKLERVSNLPGVTDVQMSRLLELCTDSTLSKTHALQVLNGADYGLPQAYDGSGIIIGIIDNGFDYQHRAFRKTDDPTATRIVRVYDPMDSTGHPLVVGTNTLAGSIFMGDQIDTLTTDCPESHGTHTASIAAGAHVNGYGGMAPGADIVLCSSRTLNIYMSETEVISSMRYIYSYADSVGKPCVISVSVSTSYGPHDGEDRVSKAIAQSVGPGRIFVIAAGNNAGYKYFYAHGPAKATKPLNMLMGYINKRIYTNSDNSFYYESMWFDNWVRAKNVRPILAFHIFDKQKKRIVWQSDLITLRQTIYSDEFSEYYEPVTSVDSVGYLYALVSQTIAGKYEVTSHAYNLRSKSYTVDADGKYVSRYQIGVSIYPPSVKYPRQPDSCYIDSWQCMANGTRGLYTDVVYVDEVTDNGDTITRPVENFYARPSDDCSAGTYTINDSVISAGAYVARNKYFSWNTWSYTTESTVIGKYCGFSGFKTADKGPTNAILPTVMAPGSSVVAAGSRYSYFGTQPWNTGLVLKTSDGCLWGVMTGTSMAAPTVAGIIAQWLQIKPDLCPSDIKHIIAETAIKDSFTNNPDEYYHYGPNGKIDAMAGARYIIENYLPHITVLKGDVDGDGIIGISDLSILLDYLLGSDVEYIDLEAADVDGDGLVQIGDVSDLADILLNQDFHE